MLDTSFAWLASCQMPSILDRRQRMSKFYRISLHNVSGNMAYILRSTVPGFRFAKYLKDIVSKARSRTQLPPRSSLPSPKAVSSALSPGQNGSSLPSNFDPTVLVSGSTEPPSEMISFPHAERLFNSDHWPEIPNVRRVRSIGWLPNFGLR